MLQMKCCLIFSSKFNDQLQQQPGCFKTSTINIASPLTKRHSAVINNTTPINKPSSIRSSHLTNQIKFNRQLINVNNDGDCNSKRVVPLAALQDGDAEAVAAPTFLEVLKQKLIAINHLVRSYTWVYIVFGITSVSLLPIQSLSELSLRIFIEILKAIVPTVLMNTFLTALNQICDVEIDKINKPYLPLASGDLSMGTGIAICIGSAILSFAMAIMSGSPPLLFVQLVCFLCGIAYSLPLPFLRWKSHTFMAPITLMILMGVNLQLPFTMHMQKYILGRPFIISRPLIFTVVIMSIFGFVNGILKDLPDVEGDEKFGMKTLCVILGKEKVLQLCVNMMLVGFGSGIIAGAFSSLMINKFITIISHSVLASIFWLQSKKVDLNNFESIFNFYMLFFKLNYVEYILIHFLR